MGSEWIIREAIGSDLPFIYSTWSNSYRDSELARGCRTSIFFTYYSQIIDQILSEKDTRIAIAANSENPEVIYSYVVHQPDIIHYAFTKKPFFRFGIARSLLSYLGGAHYCTHRTWIGRVILDRHPEVIYNPFLLFKQGENL